MPIFAGSDLQRMLEENARFLPAERTRDHFGRLTTRQTDHVLGAEWEIVLCNALAKVGNLAETAASLTPESDKSVRRPDCLFYPDHAKIADRGATTLPECLLLEISAVSDRDLEKRNPRRDFYAAFHRLVKKRRLRVQQFRLDLHGKMVAEPRPKPKPKQPFDLAAWMKPNRNHGEMRLALPAHGEIAAFIKAHLTPWIEKIVRSPDTPVVLNFDEEGVSFQVSYHPRGEAFSPGGHCSYTTTYSIEHNPVARRLVEKAGQLDHSAHRDLPAGIVLCDGGSELLADRGGYGGPTSCNLAQVIGHFFDVPEHRNVSFVVILSPQTIIHAWGLRTQLVMSAKAFSNPRAVRRVEGDTLNGFVRACLLENLPVPVNDAQNALHLLAKRGGFPEGGPPAGGYRFYG